MTSLWRHLWLIQNGLWADFFFNMYRIVAGRGNANFKAKFQVLQELFAKNHRRYKDDKSLNSGQIPIYWLNQINFGIVSQIHLETYTMLETENLNTKVQPIRMKELSVIAIYTQIASGHILLAVRNCASVAIFSKVEKVSPFFFTCSMTMLWRTTGDNFIHFEAGKSV